MGKVIDINEALPHLTSICICLECKHEWVGVMPLGTCSLECPECGLEKGVCKGVACPEEAWQCKCGCIHFFVSDTHHILCCYCGRIQVF